MSTTKELADPCFSGWSFRAESWNRFDGSMTSSILKMALVWIVRVITKIDAPWIEIIDGPSVEA